MTESPTTEFPPYPYPPPALAEGAARTEEVSSPHDVSQPQVDAEGASLVDSVSQAERLERARELITAITQEHTAVPEPASRTFADKSPMYIERVRPELVLADRLASLNEDYGVSRFTQLLPYSTLMHRGTLTNADTYRLDIVTPVEDGSGVSFSSLTLSHSSHGISRVSLIAPGSQYTTQSCLDFDKKGMLRRAKFSRQEAQYLDNSGSGCSTFATTINSVMDTVQELLHSECRLVSLTFEPTRKPVLQLRIADNNKNDYTAHYQWRGGEFSGGARALPSIKTQLMDTLHGRKIRLHPIEFSLPATTVFDTLESLFDAMPTELTAGRRPTTISATSWR